MLRVFVSVLSLAVALVGAAKVGATESSDAVACEFRYAPIAGAPLVASPEFHIDRVAEKPAPGADYQLTRGEAHDSQTLAQGDDHLTLDYDLSYQHAMKFDGTGLLTAARQSSCLAVTARVCNGEGANERCDWQTKSCASASNPFDAHYGWATVSVANGRAGFDPAGFRALNFDVKNRAGQVIGAVSAACRVAE